MHAKEGQMQGKFVSYIRVSTQKQGRSGLGLEAQREAIANYLNGGKWKLVGEFVEVESGKRSDRPELAKALSLCRLHKATLLVAKLDRLARNVAFISALMEAGVKFVAVDLPMANELTVHVMAAMAQYEAKAISERTRVALAAAKARGTALGGRKVSAERWARIASKGRKAGTASRSEMASKWSADVLPVIEDIRQAGAVSLREIAAGLNERGIETRRGGDWTAVQVKRVLDAAF
jgi:DNA invertase Pin-like site-specific DNA recombinase